MKKKLSKFGASLNPYVLMMYIYVGTFILSRLSNLFDEAGIHGQMRRTIGIGTQAYYIDTPIYLCGISIMLLVCYDAFSLYTSERLAKFCVAVSSIYIWGFLLPYGFKYYAIDYSMPRAFYYHILMCLLFFILHLYSMHNEYKFAQRVMEEINEDDYDEHLQNIRSIKYGVALISYIVCFIMIHDAVFVANWFFNEFLIAFILLLIIGIIITGAKIIESWRGYG